LFSFLFPFSVVSSTKQAAVVFTPALLFPPIFYPLLRGPIFLDPIPPLLLYIVLIIFLIGKVYTGILAQRSHLLPSSALYCIHSDAEATNALRYVEIALSCSCLSITHYHTSTTGPNFTKLYTDLATCSRSISSLV